MPTEIPPEAGKIVGIELTRPGLIIVACERGIYELTEAAHPEPRKIREILVLSKPNQE
jgi:hypothetical protein